MRRVNWLLWILALVPPAVGLLYAQGTDLQSASALLNLLGRLTGIGGLAFLLVAGALSCRVPGFDRPFGGLTKLWQTHHKLGAVAFLLLLAHPLLLAFAAAGTSLAAAAQTLWPPAFEWPSAWGWTALAAVVAFLAPSFAFFGEPVYQRWRRLHRLAAVAIAAALVHMTLTARTIYEPLNTVLWSALAAAAIVAVAYRLLFSRLAGRLSYTVADVAHPANNIVELSLLPLGQPLKYRAGQFVYLAPFDSELTAGRAEEHPYTLSSAPDEPQLRVCIKDLGDASRALQAVGRGSEVRIEGPYGAFFPGREGCDELWIAGGIGITPFLARLRQLAGTTAAHSKVDVHLIYCVQDESRAHFLDELQALAERIAAYRVTMHYFYREGPLELGFLQAHCPDFVHRQTYICGPPPLTSAASSILAAAGVQRHRIHTEEFTLL